MMYNLYCLYIYFVLVFIILHQLTTYFVHVRMRASLVVIA